MIKQSKTLLIYDSKNLLKVEYDVLDVKGKQVLVKNKETLKKHKLDVLNVNQNRSWLVGYKYYVEVKKC